jgi:FlaA1/EpsC-like NDP-sugar epimerase
LFKAAEDSIGGETFVMNMPACYIKDVAEVLMDEYGTVDVLEIGGRPGEKIDEMLISAHESDLSYYYDQNYFVTLPTKSNANLAEKYKNLKKFDRDEFSSKTFLMNKDQIKDMLKKGKFL